MSPPRVRRAQEKEQKQVAVQVVQFLLRDLAVDCLALGEVSIKDLGRLCDQCALAHHDIFDGTKADGLEFNTGVIYNGTRLINQGGVALIGDQGTGSLKVANKLEFFIPSSQSSVHVLVSHWPSRVLGINTPKREDLGVELRNAVDNIREVVVEPAIILLGDYNDEPFDASLAQRLLATRDRELARSSTNFLYNPFWRHLGESHPYASDKQTKSFGGTCFCDSDPRTHWRTIDQIMFSSSFLRPGGWQLNERETRILRLPPLDALVQDTAVKFDHFPVISVIERLN